MWNLLKSGGAVLLAFGLMTLFFQAIEDEILKVGPIVDDSMTLAARVYRAFTTPLPTTDRDEDSAP